MNDTLYRLWKHLCEWCGTKKFCWWSQEKMAKAIGWSLRKLRDVMAKLKQAGWVKIRQRGFGLTAFYYVARSENEKFTVVEKPVENAQMKLPFKVTPVSGSLTPAMAPYVKEEVKTRSKSQSSEQPKTQTDSLFFSSEETKTLERHIEACGLSPTRALMACLAKKAQRFRVTGFRIAAGIERAWRKVQGTSNEPSSEWWISKVTENELSGANARWSEKRDESERLADQQLADVRIGGKLADLKTRLRFARLLPTQQHWDAFCEAIDEFRKRGGILETWESFLSLAEQVHSSFVQAA